MEPAVGRALAENSSSELGNGVAVQGDGGRGSAGQGYVHGTVFPSAMAAPMEEGQRSADRPAKRCRAIQSKPTPVYTTEARQLRIEGEVLLKVVFLPASMCGANSWFSR